MKEQFLRTAALLGRDAVDKLSSASIAVFGIGGVGGSCAEALARNGVGKITLFDSDTVEESNINRQTVAFHSTVGRMKTEVMRDRILDINPDADVTAHNVFYLPDNAHNYDISQYDYVVDAIDTVSAKLALIERAVAANVPIISAMGAGNKIEPTMFEVDDIYNTSVCPLSRIMRKELRERGIRSLKVVYSKEKPREGMGRTPSSCSFVPPVVGLILAGEVIKDICFDRL